MKKKTKPIIAGVCAAAVAITAVTAIPRLNAKSEDEVISKETEVKYGSLVTGVTESGSLEIGSVSQTYENDWTGSSESSGTTSSSKTTQSTQNQQGAMGMAGSGMNGNTASGNIAGSQNNGNSSNTETSSSDEIALEIEKVCVSAGQVVSKGDVLYTVTEESITEAKSILKEQIASAELALKEAEYEKKSAELAAKYELEGNRLLGTTAEKEYNASIQELQSQVDSAQTALNEADERIAAIPKEIKALKKQKSSGAAGGTSQNTNGSQSSSGSQSMNGSQVSGSSQSTKGTQISGGSQSIGGSQISGGNQSVGTGQSSGGNQSAGTGQSSDGSQSTGNSQSSGGIQSTDIDSQITALETELSNLKKNYNQLKLNLERAKTNLAQGKVTAKQTYDESMLTYENAQTSYDIAIESVEDSLEDAKEALTEAKAQWKTFKNSIGDGKITAEYNGTITSLGCEKGDTLSSGTELATYTDTDAVTLTVSVSQEDIAKAQVGDTVDIVFTAYEDKTYEGTVKEISTSANSSSTVSYDVTVTVNGDIEGLYAGMTGSVTFITKKVENVTYVSNKAIMTEGAKSYVKRKTGDTTEKVEVTTGFSDGSSVEVTSGLEAGDIVYIESRVKSK